ncbi:DUF6452 family protein [Bacteroidota bacterium]
MKINTNIVLIIISISLIFSCTDDQCNADTESLLRSEILVTSSELTSIKYLDSLSIYSPQWEDSIHYRELSAAIKKEKSIYFMLSPTSDTTEIIFTSIQAPLNDTIYIYSQREYIFLSQECGFIINFTIDTILYTNNYIDSLERVTSEISTTKDGHVQIYF